MTIFFTTLFILFGANAIFMILNLNGASQKGSKTKEEATTSSASEMYPIDLVSSKFKKAV